MKLHILVENTACRDDIGSEHGLSIYFEANGRKVLVDAGQSPLFAANAKVMGIDLGKVDTAVLTHGHFDHSDGFPEFFRINHQANLYMNENGFKDYRSNRYIGVAPELVDHHRIVLTKDHTDLGDNMTLDTQNGADLFMDIDSAGMTVPQGEIRIPDTFRHEQYLLVEENGRRILFTGCSHKGVVNLAKLYKPDVLIGGFHLMNLQQEDPAHLQRLDDIAKLLLEENTVYYSGHCTGAWQYDYLKERMGDRLQYISGGTVVEL